MAIASFREELLKSLNTKQFPKSIQRLIDSGIVQECEEIDGIYYLLFGFYLHNQDFYNYRSYVKKDFVFHEKSDVIYAGGLSVDNKGIVLKGIVTPYYLNVHTNDVDNIFGVSGAKTLPYIVGTPQIFNKNDRLHLMHIFPFGEFFKVFNLSTIKSNTWASFFQGKESYEETSVVKYKVGVNDVCSSYFGKVYNGYDYEGLQRYYGKYVEVGDTVPIQFVEEKLNNKTLLTSIANKLMCNPNNGLHELSKNCKEGFRSLSIATAYAGSEIRQGTTNIARSLSGLPIIE